MPKRKKLETRLNPYFKNLQDAITAKDLAATRKTYGELNNAWTRNEAVVRDHSTAYYGKIETAISLLRSSIETEPTDSPASSHLMMISRVGLMTLSREFLLIVRVQV